MGVLVAGGTGALGSAVVSELLDSGYDCTITWIVEEERERAQAEFGERAAFVRADLVDPHGGADDAVAAVEDLEAVVDLVGGFFSGPLAHEIEWDDFDRMLRLNLSPAINLARAPDYQCNAKPGNQGRPPSTKPASPLVAVTALCKGTPVSGPREVVPSRWQYVYAVPGFAEGPNFERMPLGAVVLRTKEPENTTALPTPDGRRERALVRKLEEQLVAIGRQVLGAATV